MSCHLSCLVFPAVQSVVVAVLSGLGILSQSTCMSATPIAGDRSEILPHDPETTLLWIIRKVD